MLGLLIKISKSYYTIPGFNVPKSTRNPANRLELDNRPALWYFQPKVECHLPGPLELEKQR